MAVLRALGQTPGALRRNPVLVVPVLAIALFQVPQLLLQAVAPLVASVVSLALSLGFVFVMPFFQAGLVGMADEALAGQTSLNTFLEEGRSNYVSILAAYLGVVAVNFALGIVVFPAAVFGGFAVFSDAAGGVGAAVLLVLGLVVAFVAVAYLLFVFFVQFYGQAIVLDDLGAVDGIKRSASVVRHNLASTLGYSVLAGALGGIAGVVFGGVSLLASPQSQALFALPYPAWAGAVGGSVVVVLLASLFGAFFSVYSVAFYRSIDETAPTGET